MIQRRPFLIVLVLAITGLAFAPVLMVCSWRCGIKALWRASALA